MLQRILFMVFCLVFLFTGCDKEIQLPDGSGSQSNGLLIEWNEELHSLREGEREFMVVTDTTGKVLSWKEIETAPNIKLYSDGNYEGKSINVYVINRGPEYYNFTAYLNIKRGSSWIIEYNQTPVKIGDMDLNIKNAGQGFEFLTYGINWGQTITNLPDTSSLFMTNFQYYENGKIYAQLVKDNKGYYEFFDIDPTKSSFDIDYSSLKNTSTRKLIQNPEAEFGNFILSGKKVIDGNSHVYSLFERTFSGSSFDIYYPEISSLEYSTHLTYNSNGRSYSYSYPGKVVTNFEKLDAEAEVVSFDPKQFKASFSGNFDHYYAYYTNFTNPTNRRNLQVFSSKNNAEFSIPDFSEIMPIEKFETSDLNLREFKLIEIEGYEENEDYFKYYSTLPYYAIRPEATATIRQVNYLNLNK